MPMNTHPPPALAFPTRFACVSPGEVLACPGPLDVDGLGGVWDPGLPTSFQADARPWCGGRNLALGENTHEKAVGGPVHLLR